MEFNRNGFPVGETDFITGLDAEKLKQMPVKDLAAKYCRLSVLIDGDPTGRSFEDKNKMMQVYEQEFFRRVLEGNVHPDDFEKLCDEWFREHQNDNENKTDRLNSELGYY